MKFASGFLRLSSDHPHQRKRFEDRQPAVLHIPIYFIPVSVSTPIICWKAAIKPIMFIQRNWPIPLLDLGWVHAPSGHTHCSSHHLTPIYVSAPLCRRLGDNAQPQPGQSLESAIQVPSQDPCTRGWHNYVRYTHCKLKNHFDLHYSCVIGRTLPSLSDCLFLHWRSVWRINIEEGWYRGIMDRFQDSDQLDRLFFQLRSLRCPKVRVSTLQEWEVTCRWKNSICQTHI